MIESVLHLVGVVVREEGGGRGADLKIVILEWCHV